MATRKPKGEVSVESYRGFLRLRWRLQGERYTISLGLPDDVINQQIAAQKAHTIKMDILSGNFDSTLKKYRADNRPGKTISAVKLFQRFIQHKTKKVQPRTLEKYYGLVSWLEEFYGDRPASAKNSEEFIHWLLENLEAVTAELHRRFPLTKGMEVAG